MNIVDRYKEIRNGIVPKSFISIEMPLDKPLANGSIWYKPDTSVMYIYEDGTWLCIMEISISESNKSNKNKRIYPYQKTFLEGIRTEFVYYDEYSR